MKINLRNVIFSLVSSSCKLHRGCLMVAQWLKVSTVQSSVPGKFCF